MTETLTPNQKGQPGYEGHLNDRVVSIPRLLNDAGYFTAMAGKWHLGEELEQDPSKRGSDKAYTMLTGGTSHFDDEAEMYKDYPPIYRENGKTVHVPEGFYSCEFYTRKLTEYLDEQPFFGYLAFTAPHDPLHTPDVWIDKYAGKYAAGYDALSYVQSLCRRRRRRSPLIISGPGVNKPGTKNHSFAHVMDIAATMLDASQTQHPGTSFQDRKVEPLRGLSLSPVLVGKTDVVHKDDVAVSWELFGMRAVRKGDYKLLRLLKPFGPDEWQLYDLSKDPGETDDLSVKMPELRTEMIALWDAYAKESGVILPSKNLFGP